MIRRAPSPLGDGRRRLFLPVAAGAFGRAAAAAAAAVATRALFSRWHEGADPTAPALALAAAMAAFAALGWAGRVAAERLGQDYAAAARRAVFDQLARMPAEAVAARRTGGLTLRLSGDLAALSGWIARGLAPLLAAACAIPAALAVLVWLSPAAAAGAAGPLLLAALGMALAARALGRRKIRLRAARARLAMDMAERAPLAPELRLMGRLGAERARLDSAADRLARAAAADARLHALLRALPDAAAGAAACGAALAAFAAGESAATLAGALAALGLVAAQFRDLAGVADRRRAHEAARARLETLLAAPRLSASGPDRLRPEKAALEFAGVTAGPATGFDLTLRRGETVALVGPNGSGKSALLRVAAGLAAPEAGRVRVSGAAPAALGAADRRRAILHLRARPALLKGSLRRALTMGLAGRPDDAAILAAAAVAGFAPALERLGGLDGRIGEGGRALSDGELARLGLARLALAPAALALVDGLDDALDADGRARLTEILAARDGAALVACRSASFGRRLGRVVRLAPPPDEGPAA